MKISNITPADLLNYIENEDFFMCLANIANKSKRYLDFYKIQSDKGKFVLLDNGEAEGEQLDLETLERIIKEINPNEIVLSDDLYSKENTIKKSKESLDYYKSIGYKGQYMFVPHGKDFNEWCECLKDFDLNEINTIGVYKNAVSDWNDRLARVKCCEFITKNYPEKDIHLLGSAISFKEVYYIDSLYHIRSNDTALSYIYALNNLYINKGDRPEGKINFLKSELNQYQEIVFINNLYMSHTNIFV